MELDLHMKNTHTLVFKDSPGRSAGGLSPQVEHITVTCAPGAPGILPIAKSLHWHEVGQDPTAGWQLPGQGIAYWNCGQFTVKGCLEHNPGYFKKFKRNCGRASCPICYRSWLVKATDKVVKRIEAGKPGGRSRKPIHVTASPPVNVRALLLTKKGYLKHRRLAITLLKEAGLFGGVLIYHPYRETDLKKWYFSPHFHAICYGWVKAVDVFYRTGWVIKNHLVRRDIGATAFYQLSHAGVKSGHHVVSWWGSCSWRQLKRLPPERAEPETCPICGNLLRRVVYLGTGDNPLNDSEISELEHDNCMWDYRLPR